LGLIQGRGIVDPLAALLTGEGINHHVRRAYQAGVDCCGGLERQQFVHQRRVKAAAELGQHFGEHEMPLGAIALHLPNPARLPHRQVGPQLATALFIRAVQLRFEEL
jgi:hypothetical protein